MRFGHFLETVEVELADEGLEFGVAEVSGEDLGDEEGRGGDDELGVGPVDDGVVGRGGQDGEELLDEVGGLWGLGH